MTLLIDRRLKDVFSDDNFKHL